jgi:hypothetical protein
MMNRRCSMIAAVMGAVMGCSDSARETPNAQAQGSQSATPRAPLSASPASGWTVSPTGIGSVRAEMTLAQASRQLGTELSLPPAAASQCAYVQPIAGLDSVMFMVVNERIARVDVTGGRVATVEGARVGDTEAKIRSLYAGRLEAQPHKYVQAGHYLVVRPPERADSAYRLVFETDGHAVTRYRSGRLPEVMWVEGCS